MPDITRNTVIQVTLSMLLAGGALMLTGCGDSGGGGGESVGDDDNNTTNNDDAPTCGDGVCDEGEDETSCEADCGAQEPVCGDGTCEAGETEASCEADCAPEGPICGDGACDEGEDEASCAADCGDDDPFCGDGACNGDEDSESCPDDCPVPGPVCGDGECQAPEDAESCPDDCAPAGPVCGDAVCEEGETRQSCPDDCSIPTSLTVRWSNLNPEDRVTFGKQIVIEFDDPGIEIPETWIEQQYWTRRFKATMYRLGAEGEREEVPLQQSWLKNDPKRRFRPAMLIEPLVRPIGVGSPRGWPKATGMELRIELGEGEDPLIIPFRTLPVQYDQFIEVETTVPVRDCPTCFPYEVDAFVYLPPGYVDPDNPDYNNAAIHLPNTDYGDAEGGSPTQRYPVVVLMHTAGEYQNNRSLANAAGLRMAWGLMEPAIFVLPNARLNDENCDREPQLRSQRCHTRFVGLWKPDETIFSYRDFLADDLRPHMAALWRIRGSNSDGEITNAEIFRRSFSLYGLSAGGYGVLVNAFGRPDAYYATVSIVPGIPSSYNPWSFHGNNLRPRNQVCPGPDNHDYPLVRHGFGYRDYSGVDPETDRRRIVHFRDRRVPPGASNCYQGVPEVQHELVRGGLCPLDIACLVDPEAPDYASKTRVIQEEHPYHGNIYFDTAIFDQGGPPAAFMDLDQALDRAEIPHTFRYEDRGALFHNWQAVSDRGLGFEYIDNGRGLPRLRGNFPGPGSVYPFLSRAMEGVGNPDFNSWSSSEFTTSAMDTDRDGIIWFEDPERPDISDTRDNCPDHYNAAQLDKDGDGIGDVCDPDIDGDGIPNEDDPCNWPQLPIDPNDPDGPTFGGCQDDVDGDGVDDFTDLCPETFDPLQIDTDRDNRGDECEPDDDGDGVPDAIDNCRLDQNEDQADVDGNGFGDICDPSCLLRPFSDGDADGATCLEDCNDGNPDIHPGADELCDGVDNNCDGQVDEGC